MSLWLFDDVDVESPETVRERAVAERRRLAAVDADPTPPDVARLGCAGVRDLLGITSPARVLCPCAGAGAWVAAAAETWPEAEINALELRPEELPHLQHHTAHRGYAAIGDFLTDDLPGSGAPDLIIDNIPFELALEFMQRGLQVVRPGGHVAWFVRVTLGDADRVKKWLAANPFQGQLEFVDRFRFREGINPENGKPWGVDSTGYKMPIWRSGSRPFAYVGKRLPSLPPASRRWRRRLWNGEPVKPGTEYLYPGDVEAPARISIR